MPEPLAIHAIGRGLAAAKGLVERHTTKQVDRLIGNKKLDLDDLFDLWVPYVLAGRKEAMINLDWTEFDDDDHSMLVATLQTKHGRATPLLWKTAIKSKLKDQRNAYEDDLLIRLGEAGERAGLDRLLKTSTKPGRQLSLFRQGLRWYDLMPTLREDRLKLLIESWYEVLAEHEMGRECFGAI